MNDEIPAAAFEPVARGDDATALVDGFINRAENLRASDLFLAVEDGYVSVSVKRLGAMLELDRLNLAEGRRCMNHIKAVAGLDLVERRRPLDGRWIYRNGARTIDLRISIIPTLYGEDLTMRILNREMSNLPLDDLGMVRHQCGELTSMLAGAGGLILVTGPYGAGRTTTLYACLHHLNDGQRKINTIEDPVEYSVAGLRQSQVNTSIGLDFPDLFRAVLRQSPDVIMIGEIRDPITAQTAIRAANSGHLVLATLHAPVAAAAVQSMLSLGVNAHFLSTSLRGVVTQRLVRVLCPRCKSSLDIEDAPVTFDEIRPWLEPHEGRSLHSAEGCDACNRTGFTDRTGVFEVLPITVRLRKLIAQGATARDIEAEAIKEGMIELRRAGLLKVAQGVTTVDELLRVVPTEYLGLDE
jgi:type II secretory ATPase GspE/PulE/Tfp pilus assembly ATPase PilB-like protein